MSEYMVAVTFQQETMWWAVTLIYHIRLTSKCKMMSKSSFVSLHHKMRVSEENGDFK